MITLSFTHQDVEIGKYQNRCSENETKLADMVLQVNLAKMEVDKIKTKMRMNDEKEKVWELKVSVLSSHANE